MNQAGKKQTPNKAEPQWTFKDLCQPQTLAQMRGQSFWCNLPLSKPFEQNGETFIRIVLRVEVTSRLQLKSTDEKFLCRTHDEAKMVFEALCQEHLRKHAMIPTACDVLATATLGWVHQADFTLIPLSGLPDANCKTEPAAPCATDKPFLDIGHANFTLSNGTTGGALSIGRNLEYLIASYRLCKYHQPYHSDGLPCPFGVERVRGTVSGVVKEVDYKKRWLFQTEAEALKWYLKCKNNIPAELDMLMNGAVASEQEKAEDVQLQAVQNFIDASHDQEGKDRHQQRKGEILEGRRQREREQAEACRLIQEREQERAAAQAILFATLFPNLHAVKAQINARTVEEMAQWHEPMRRALKIDCRRLKISSPFNTFSVDDDLVKRLSAAARAKSPARPEDIETILNWVAKGYYLMPEAKIARLVSTKPLSPATFGKRLNKQYGLKSELKGRPETEVG